MFSKRPGLRSPSSVAVPQVITAPEQTTQGIHSKIVGTTFADNGQSTLEEFAKVGQGAFESDNPRFTLFLRAEPDNSFDSDAIAVYARANISGKEQKLGHIQNSGRKCPTCGATYEKVRKSSDAKVSCDRCGSELIRDGLASALCERARKAGVDVDNMFEVKIDWSSGGITGGQQQKYTGSRRSWGCNILITKREK